MHVLRSSYLPLYAQKIIPPFTTDPFPPTDLAPGSLRSSHRETVILDLYILIKVRQDLRSDESELYLDSEDEQYRDMFNLMQVRATFPFLLTSLLMTLRLARIASGPCRRPRTQVRRSRRSHLTLSHTLRKHKRRLGESLRRTRVRRSKRSRSETCHCRDSSR